MPEVTNQKLAQFSESLKNAKTVDAVSTLLVEVENSLLKTVLDDHVNGRDTESYEARNYLVGERNTRGLSWKLVLLRVVAAANFCERVRLHVHGGATQIVGQPSNIDATIQIFEALASSLEPVGQAAFTSFNDERKEGDPTVHKVGWVNQFMLDAPGTLESALTARREQATASNAKLGKTVEEKNAALAEYRKSLAPVKAAPAPKTPKDPNAPRKSKKKSDAEIIAAQNEASETEAAATEAESSTADGTATDTPAE